MTDPVNHPSHYTHRGVECIEIAEHMSFCLGNAMKYIWRAGSKGDMVEDLKKARWYIDREIQKLTGTPVKDELLEAARGLMDAIFVHDAINHNMPQEIRDEWHKLQDVINTRLQAACAASTDGGGK